jgi:Tol biopolymer transport system component
MKTYDDNLVAERFAALAPPPLDGDWDDVLGRAGAHRKPRRTIDRLRSRHSTRRRRLAVIAAAALVVVGTASALATVRDFFFGTTLDECCATWSPDGRRIAYAVYRSTGGPAEVFVVNADGGQRSLTREWGLHDIPVWSPDGRRIAFQRNPCDRADEACVGTTGIYVMKADGTGTRRLAGGVRVRLGRGGQPVSPPVSPPAWSPDGRWITFVSDRDGNSEIYIMKADGSGQRNLTRNVAFDGDPVWSADGLRIAFARKGRNRDEIHVANADGTGQWLLGRGANPVWSPDGRKIAFSRPRANTGVYLMNADGSGQRKLTRPSNHRTSDRGHVWSPDGRKIAFVRSRWDTDNSEIYVMNADGSRERNLTRNSKSDRAPVWSPDGRQIAFVSDRDGHDDEYVMNADGSALRHLRDFHVVVEPWLAQGRVSRTVEGVRFSFDVPRPGWYTGPHGYYGGKFHNGSLFVSKSTVGGQAAENVIFWTGFRDGGEATPCAKLLGSALEGSSADLAAAAARAPGTRLVSGPTRVTIGGRPAQHVVLTVREDLGCEPGYFFSWRPRNVCWGECWLSQSSVGNTISVWIVDVGGTRLFIEAETRTHHAATGEAVLPNVYRKVEQDISQIIGSIRFD